MKDGIMYRGVLYTCKKEPSNLLFEPLNENDENSKSLIIYTTPKPKQRPRFSNGHTYTPKQTQDYEELIRRAWQLSHNKIFTGYVRMELKFFMPIPKSWSKTKQEEAVKAIIRPASTPDIDNLVKAIQDALNEVAIWDDRQIVDLAATEYYAEVPRIEIKITEI